MSDYTEDDLLEQEEDEEEQKEYEPALCRSCDGSGEGMADGRICRACDGWGIER